MLSAFHVLAELGRVPIHRAMNSGTGVPAARIFGVNFRRNKSGTSVRRVLGAICGDNRGRSGSIGARKRIGSAQQAAARARLLKFSGIWSGERRWLEASTRSFWLEISA